MEGSVETARSVAFATLGINSLFYVFSVRTLTKPFWVVGLLVNKWLLLAVAGGVVLQILPFVFSPLGAFLGIVPISLSLWAEVIIAATVMFVIIEIAKLAFRK